VASGFLYDEEFVLPGEEGSHGWTAVISLPTGVGSQLQEALRDKTLRIGSSRTRGLGQWKVRAVQREDRPWGLDPLQKRMERFQQAVSTPTGEWLVPILCVTPVVLPDSMGRYTVQPDSHAMARALDPSGTVLTADHLEPVLALADLERMGGWNSLPGLPAPSDLAIVPGSILVWKIKKSDPVKVIGLLSEVEQRGLGLRRAEGLGAIVIAHPIHCEVREHVQ
jgi:hypothetical protein